MKILETEQAFLAEVRNAVAGDAIGPDLTTALIEGVQGAERDGASGSPEADGLNLQIGGWVVRDRDLPILEAMGLVGAGVAALLGPGALVAGALVAGLTSFSKIVWSVWRKSSRLSKDEVAIIGVLKVLGPLDTEDLMSKTMTLRPDMSREDVDGALASLTEVELLDGDIVELVRRDKSGRWRVRDL